MAVRSYGNAPSLVGSTVIASPTLNDVLVDSGSVAYTASYTFNVVLGATVNAVWTVARRNVGNTADIAGHVFTMLTAANSSSEFVFALRLEAGERVVVRAGASNAGNNYLALMMEAYV